jgi:hypothetical protein
MVFTVLEGFQHGEAALEVLPMPEALEQANERRHEFAQGWAAAAEPNEISQRIEEHLHL